MPSPTQTRALRVRRLVAVARSFMERGVDTYALASKLGALAQSSWPTVREATRQAYIVSALETVFEGPSDEFDLLEAFPWEAK